MQFRAVGFLTSCLPSYLTGIHYCISTADQGCWFECTSSVLFCKSTIDFVFVCVWCVSFILCATQNIDPSSLIHELVGIKRMANSSQEFQH